MLYASSVWGQAARILLKGNLLFDLALLMALRSLTELLTRPKHLKSALPSLLGLYCQKCRPWLHSRASDDVDKCIDLTPSYADFQSLTVVPGSPSNSLCIQLNQAGPDSSIQPDTRRLVASDEVTQTSRLRIFLLGSEIAAAERCFEHQNSSVINY